MISFVFSRCQNEEYLSNPETKKVSVAKEWFKAYESNGDNLDLFQNLNYEWANAEVRETKDGVQLIVVPIAEVKKDESEIWEQRLYIYKLKDNHYKALLYEFYPEDAVKTNSNSFSGYITAWNLKNGFVKSAKFANDILIENGEVEILSTDRVIVRSNTAKVPQEVDNGESSVRVGEILRPVLVQNNYRDSMYYIPNPRGSDITGGDSADYTSGYTGGGGSGSGISQTGLNPCDKIKILKSNANFLAKQEELRKKTNLKVESGYMQSNKGPFTALTGTSSTASADQLSFPMDENTIGYMHTHLDSYDRVEANGDLISVKPIQMFSPSDVKQFLILVLNANKNSIPIDDIYGTVISSKGTYQLRFTGAIADVVEKTNNISWGIDLDKSYTKTMKNNGLERGFLKFLNEQIRINGIDLYKIESSGNSKKILDNNGKITTINCN